MLKHKTKKIKKTMIIFEKARAHACSRAKQHFSKTVHAHAQHACSACACRVRTHFARGVAEHCIRPFLSGKESRYS